MAIHHAGGHLLQIVRRGQIVARQTFRLQGATIAIHLHLIHIRKASLLDEGIRQLIKTALRYPDLCPSAFLQHGVILIALLSRGSGTSSLGLRLDVQLKANQFLILAVSEYQRHQRYIEHALFPGHAYRLRHLRQLRQGRAANGLITSHIGLTHFDKLRILDADGIDRICIIRPQLLLPGIDGQ